MFRRKWSLAEANVSGDWLDSDSWRGWEAPCNLIRGEHYRLQSLEKLAGTPRPGGYLIPCVVTFVRESQNPHDSNAIRALVALDQVGFMAKEIAAQLSPLLDRAGCSEFGLAGLIRGGSHDFQNLGVHVWPTRRLTPAPIIDIEPSAGFQVRWPPQQWEGDPSFATSTETSTGDRDLPGQSESKDPPGHFGGKHYTEYVEDIKALKRHGALDEAEQLLLNLVEAVEAEAKTEGWGVAPWYYEQLAVIHRKRGDFRAEVEILERYAAQEPAPGASTPQLLERLKKARAKLEPSGEPRTECNGEHNRQSGAERNPGS